jgi:uncharacterized membrane protein YkoI
MKKLFVTTVAVCLSAFVLSAQAYTGQEFSKDAKIHLKVAREIALKAYPGKITDEELEKENGGSGLRYSFDIKRGKGTKTQEVGVDAVTGKLLENSAEGPNPD